MSEQTRKVHVAKQIEGPEGVIDTEEIEEFDPDILIKQAVAEFGGEPGENLSVKIYSIEEGKYDWCFACTPADLPVNERIRRDFGGGRYEARLYSGAKIRRRLPFGIREMLKKPDATPAPTNDVAAVVQGISKLGEMIVSMSTGFSQQIAQLQTGAAGPAVTFNPLDMQKSMIDNMVAMKMLVGDNAGGGSNVKDMIDVFRSGVDLAKEVGGEGGGDDMLGFLSKGTEMITKIANAAATVPTAPPTATPAVVHTPPATGSTREQQIAALKVEIGRLVRVAQRGSAPALYADLILDNVPVPVIESFLTDGNSLEKLAKLDPAVMNHQQWFTELGNEVRAALAEQETAPEDAGEGANAPTANGEAVKSADSDAPTDTEGAGGGQGDA